MLHVSLITNLPVSRYHRKICSRNFPNWCTHVPLLLLLSGENNIGSGCSIITQGNTQSQMGTHSGIWYLLHRRATKTQTSQRIRSVSSETPLLAYTEYESSGRLSRKFRSLAPTDSCACLFKANLQAYAMGTSIS